MDLLHLCCVRLAPTQLSYSLTQQCSKNNMQSMSRKLYRNDRTFIPMPSSKRRTEFTERKHRCGVQEVIHPLLLHRTPPRLQYQVSLGKDVAEQAFQKP